MKYQKLNLFAIKLWNWTKKSLLACFEPKNFWDSVDSRVRRTWSQSRTCQSWHQSCQSPVASRQLAVLAHIRASALAACAFDLAPARTHCCPLSFSLTRLLPLSYTLPSSLPLCNCLPPSRTSSPLQIHLIASHRFASHLIWEPGRSTCPDSAT